MGDTMSPILVALLPFFVVGVVFALTRALGPRSRVAHAEEPTCGKCGYIVRGIEGFTCPECGSDLREVGIIPPGGRRPMGTAMRLLVWTVATLPAGFGLGLTLTPLIAPVDLVATRRRVIFIQSPNMNATIPVTQQGRQRVYGRPRINAATVVPMQTATLDLRRGTMIDVMTVDTPTRAAHFTDAAGKRIDGALDAEFVTQWFNANGHNAGAVRDRAADVVAAVAEMDNPPGRGGAGFSRFSPNPARGGIPDVTAHPASPAFVRPQNTPYTNAAPVALAGVIWLLGLPFVLHRRRGVARVESPRDANQA